MKFEMEKLLELVAREWTNRESSPRQYHTHARICIWKLCVHIGSYEEPTNYGDVSTSVSSRNGIRTHSSSRLFSLLFTCARGSERSRVYVCVCIEGGVMFQRVKKRAKKKKKKKRIHREFNSLTIRAFGYNNGREILLTRP